MRGERIASGITVRYSGPRTADALILSIVDGVRKAGDADDTAALLVVTDDRDLRHGARLRGARTAGSKWLLGRLGSGRVQAASIGNPRPPRVVAGAKGVRRSSGLFTVERCYRHWEIVQNFEITKGQLRGTP